MKLGFIYILTEKQLAAKIEAAKSEQRHVNAVITEKLLKDNTVLAHVARQSKRKR